ncbi:Spo0E family sporulation regulatory protein-aspartic acid phosphatase [Cytobacillus sp. FJAT-54145]|uniref:Spo0E family sporulation regulatory protein-aspartic acid phosphatase n=1 Tax=Cytobacillus spartinae TaxID=3299023 RepID=A0ABW6KFC1_9BACI
MDLEKDLLDAIAKETDELALLVRTNGLNCTETVKKSQKLDRLILKYQQRREKYRHEENESIHD